jgi:hypothetical protein
MLASRRWTFLIALSGTLDCAKPGLPCAISGEMNLAAVAAATDHDLRAAVRTEEQPRRPSLGMQRHYTGWTNAAIARILALHA